MRGKSRADIPTNEQLLQGVIQALDSYLMPSSSWKPGLLDFHVQLH